MLSVLLAGGGSPPSTREQVHEPPDLLEWLRAGRLTLLDEYQEPVGEKEWSELPPSVRANALADFRRVARAKTKAVVLSLRA
jgi:hypothetical protein